MAGAGEQTAARAEALIGAGNLAAAQGDNAAAAAAFQESLDIWRRLGDRRKLAQATEMPYVINAWGVGYSANWTVVVWVGTVTGGLGAGG